MELILLILGAGLAASLVGGLGGSGGDADSINQNTGPMSPSGGTNSAELLTGTNFSDTLEGLAGNDTLQGLIGDDLLEGNADNDQLFGDEGDDTLRGGFGNDLLGGGTGLDLLQGSDGDDTLRGGADNDTLEGGLNADFLQGDGGNDFLRGGPGADFLTGNEGEDSLEGGPGDDTLVGIVGNFNDVPDSSSDGADTLEGWEGADRIVLGSEDEAYGEFASATADGAGDTFIIGTWIDDPATVHDFDPDVDRIELYHSDTTIPSPLAPVISSTNMGGEITFQVAFDGTTLLLLPMGTSGDVVTAANIDVINTAESTV